MAALTIVAFQARAQEIEISSAKFHTGDDMAWSQPSFNDSQWQSMSVTRLWTYQGVTNPNNYAWYRMRVVIPSSLRSEAVVKDVVTFHIAKVDDCDETYLNGVLIGKTGSMPGDKEGYKMAYDAWRDYQVKADGGLIKWDQENVIAVRVYNGNDPGGIFDDKVRVKMAGLQDLVKIAPVPSASNGKSVFTVALTEPMGVSPRGAVSIEAVDMLTRKTYETAQKNVRLGKKSVVVGVPYDSHRQTRIAVSYTDQKSGKHFTKTFVPQYILTPDAPLTPRYNGPKVYGVRPGSPIILRMAFSGEKPMRYSIVGKPEGLEVDASTGVLSGSVAKRGSYKMTLVAENAKGRAEQEFILRVGDKIALTPPMGWNSWNCWGLSVSQEKVISSAQALLDKGLADYGYSYINVDDAWESAKRNPDGTIGTNEKFPDMKGLGDWLHSHGLKFGIYSSPGDLTCGRYLGSIDHEEQDAKTYNEWGVDYLKYDWCGYGREFDKHADKSVASYVRPYLKMERYLREQPRDIFYSLCQYGMAEVWKWGHAVDANSWRTTGDITDTWESLYDIGFCRQVGLEQYAQPGHWNDPDMLIVGKVGWSDKLRDTRLNADEQYTHISLWALLAANMLIGCDIAQMDEFTVRLLCNNEVNAVNQDPLGRQAKQEIVDGDIQVWKRPLDDGSFAVGIFNLGLEDTMVDFGRYLSQLGLDGMSQVRDLWRQQDQSTTDLNFFIASHGVKLIKVK